MAIDLTTEQRQAIWQKLTPLQKETLQEFKKYQMQSLFLTENFLKDNEWQFADFKENPLYPYDEENKLFCRCGRELKYQFVLVSKQTGEKLALGSTHFAQHIGVDPKIAQQIQTGTHRLDRGVDLVLAQVDKGLHFPQRYYNHFTNRGLKSNCSATFLKRLAAFAKADLPLYDEDSRELLSQLKKSGFQINGTPARVNTPAPATNKFKKLVQILRNYEFGEALEVDELAEILQTPANDLVRWLGLLTTEKFPVQLKEANGTFYRIR